MALKPGPGCRAPAACHRAGRKQRCPRTRAAAADHRGGGERHTRSRDYLSLAAIVGELRSIGSRLERVGSAAEAGEQYGIAVNASAQQVRLAETKSRLGGHIAPQKNQGGGEVPVFNLTICFDGGRTEKITMVDGRAGEVIENAPLPILPDEADEPAADEEV